jgi:hypothetical protein
VSLQAITASLKVQGLSAAEKLLLIVVSNYANDKLECFPSQTTLASDTSMSDRNIRRVFLALEKKGLIGRKPRYRGNIRTTDTLVLHLDIMSARAATTSAPARTPCPKGADTMSDRTFKEPPIEPSAREALASCDHAAPPTPEERKEQAAAARELAASLRGLVRPLRPDFSNRKRA